MKTKTSAIDVEIELGRPQCFSQKSGKKGGGEAYAIKETRK